MRVSVLMPAYNAERYLAQAIDSVLSQTYENFEFIIIDDGSIDNTLSVAESYAQKDSRIRVVHQPNMGMGATLNRALDLVGNEWIVRMDADDVMLPNRIERQLAFLKENPDVDVAGTGVYYIGQDGKVIGRYHPPLTSRADLEKMVQRNVIVYFTHPTVIMRKSVVKRVGGYRPEFWPVEDLDLWNRIAEHGYNLRVQPEYLLKYRKEGYSISVAAARPGWLKTEWVETCMLKRRRGEPEPRWEDFLAAVRQDPWWYRLNRERKLFAKVLYSAAVSYFSKHDYYLFAPTFLGSLLLEPDYVLKKAVRAQPLVRIRSLLDTRKPSDRA